MKSQKTKRIVFIADFFRSDLLGGAECNDARLIEYLRSQGQEVEEITSSKVSENLIESFDNEETVYLVSNFIGLSENSKKALMDKGSYIIYEHDHKYVKTRDPSRFKEFKAPKGQIINKEFYSKAKAVVVLSKICKEVLEKNIPTAKVFNIGCSLWSEERLKFLEQLSESEKTNEVAVLRSGNPIKGTAQAVSYCEKKNISYELVSSSDEKEFLTNLSKFEKLVYFPQVLETFCRLTAEAKMMNCKLVTKRKLLGFGSEDCYELSGKQLIQEIRVRNRKAFELFDNLINESETKKDITAILTCYKRPHLLLKQIEALKVQSVPPKDIWVWINRPEEGEGFEEHLSLKELEKSGAKVFLSNHNWKFYGRFAAAMLVDTEYVAIFDDDTFPGKDWFSNCLQTMSKKEGILGGVGCVLPGDRYYGHHRIGWSNPNEEIEEVDLVGHAWFFKREWLQYLWREKPQTWENGEDIQFSYMAQKYGGVKTYVPPHPRDKPEMFSSLKGMEYGVDEVATSNQRNHTTFYKQRDECVRKAVRNGWKLLRS